MVDPMHRPQLIQSLCKVSYIKADLIQQLMKETGTSTFVLASLPTKDKEAQMQEPSIKQESSTTSPILSSVRPNANLPDPKLFPFLSRRLACSSTEDPDVEVNAAKAMLSLGQSHLINNNQSESDISGKFGLLETEHTTIFFIVRLLYSYE